MAELIRVGLCDDHAMVRSGLRRLLEEGGGFEVVGEAATADEAVALAREARPDVFVVDLGLRGESGVDATRRIGDVSPTTAVLVLTVHDDVAYLRRAFAAGARGYLVKDAADVDLVLAVRRVASGKQHVDPRLGAALVTPEAGPAGAAGGLSDSDLRILSLIALGHTNAEIAADQRVSVRTVESRRADLQRKLGLRTRAELVRFARQAGLGGGDRQAL
ncbi:MAG TPA: response regulator transcription factor [Acidimicrobiia bacterium]|nr:response regulator transcription factor [Acidimicrobiia bacterium]